jgi:hypothetical protein
MSQLIEKLTRLRRADPQPIGFMTARAASEKPRMQLVAFLKPGIRDKVNDGLKSADAVLLEIESTEDAAILEKECQDDDKTIRGGWLKSASAEIIDPTMKAACDFIVFPSGAPLSVTSNEKMGRILELDISLSEALLRTANDLPVDGMLVTGQDPVVGLTLERLMQIQRLVYMVNKPVIIPVSANIAQDELQALCNTGIAGAAVEVTDKKSAGKLADLRKAMENLKPAESRKKNKANPILPRLQPEAPTPQHGEDGEEEEDE